MRANGSIENEGIRIHTWATATEIANKLRLHPKTVLRMARLHKIPALRAGRAIRFSVEMVEEALTT